VDDRLAQAHRGVVEGVSRFEVVRPVDDDVVPGDEPIDVVGPEPLDVLLHRRLGVERPDGRLGRVGLAHPEPVHAVEHLALEVRLLDHVVVDDADGADPGRREVQRDGRPETAGTDEQHLRVEKLALALEPDLGDEDLPVIAPLL
jgi:hypothetical protein